MIWLKNDDEPFVPGDEGILAQACYFDKDFVEWVPRSRAHAVPRTRRLGSREVYAT